MDLLALALVCEISITTQIDLEEELKECKKGDVIAAQIGEKTAPAFIAARICDFSKQIVFEDHGISEWTWMLCEYAGIREVRFRD